MALLELTAFQISRIYFTVIAGVFAPGAGRIGCSGEIWWQTPLRTPHRTYFLIIVTMQ